MREAPKTTDHVAVAHRVIDISLEGLAVDFRNAGGECREQCNTALLQFRGFAVFQRQVKKYAFDGA